MVGDERDTQIAPRWEQGYAANADRQKTATSTGDNPTAYDRSAYGGPATEHFWDPEDDASFSEVLQNVTPQLLDFFRVRGCGPILARTLAHELSGDVKTAVREVLSRLDFHAKLGVITIGNLKLDLERRLFWRGDQPIHLTPKEFDLLALMMTNPDVALTHVKLLRSVWGIEYGGELEYLRTYMCALRKKIEENPSNPEYIVSEPWIGYRFRSPNGPASPRLDESLLRRSDTA